MKTKPLYKTSIGYEVKEEWMNKEYGSWEDHNEPESGHIYPLLCSMPYDKIICKTREDAELVLSSASHQSHWNDDDPIVQRLKRKAGKITNELRKLLVPVS